MGGRYSLTPPAEVVNSFSLHECADLTPRYNIPPGNVIAAFRQSPEGKRVLHQLKWGLVAFPWLKALARHCGTFYRGAMWLHVNDKLFLGG